MTKLYLIFLFIILFFSQNIMNFLGINNQPIYVIYIVVSLVFIALNKQCIIRKNKHVAILFLTALIIGGFKIFFDKSAGSKQVTMLLISAPLLFGSLPVYWQKSRFWDKGSKLFIAFFICECCLAILERLTLNNIFPWMSRSDDSLMLIDNGDLGEFRSFGLLGHPLQNALPVATIMTFILFSTTIKAKHKVALWLMGFVAILCFNTRSSIVGTGLIMLAYILYQYLSNKKLSFAKKNVMLFGIAAISVAIIALAIHFHLGGRLMEMGLYDEESAQVRVNTWSIFDFFDVNYFLWGLPQNERQMVIYHSGLFTTENFWIDYMLSIGIVALSALLLIYIYTLRNLYKGYSLIQVIFTAGTFLLIASTNNSLSSGWMPIFIYLMAIASFSNQEKIYQR